MKKWILLLALCLLLTGCREVYTGPVEQKRVLLAEEILYVSEEASEGARNIRWEYTFDTEGNRVGSLTRSNGRITQIYKLRYDENGNMISCATYDCFLGLPIFWFGTTEHTYDAEGRELTMTGKQPRFWNNCTYSYTYEADCITMVTTDHQGNVRSTTKTYLDEAGRPIRRVDPNYECHWYYDEAGNEIREEQLENDTIIYHEEKTYDDQNRLLTQTWTSGGEVKSHRYTYDDANHTVTRHSPNGFYEVEHYNELGEMYYAATYRDSGELYSEKNVTYGTIDVAGREDVS